METLDRRTFLTRAAVAGGGLVSMGALERLVARDARGNPTATGREPYGPLRRVRDQRGVEVLALPAGFSYVTFSHTGSKMSDGNPTPLALDGMGSFAGGRATDTARARHGDQFVRLVRNSEDRNPAGTAAGCWAIARRPTTRRRSAARPRSSTTSSVGSWSRTSSASTAPPSTARAASPTAVATG